MSTCASFQVRMASIMEVLAKTAVADITKLVDDRSAALRLEICKSHRQNEALKRKLLLMEGELRAVRGYGEGEPANSLNISFEVQVCDEFRDAQRPKTAWKGHVSATERVLNERSSTHPARDDQNIPVEEKTTPPDALDIKCESIDGELDWSESLLLSEDRPVEDPKSSQSQVEQKISEKNTCGTSGSAAANGGEGPLCKEEVLHMQPCPTGDPEKGLQAELKQEPEGQPLTPTLPLMESVEWGLQIQSVWSKASGLEKTRRCRGSLEHGDARKDDVFSPAHYRASRRPSSRTVEEPASHLEQKPNGWPLDKECRHGLAGDISAEMVYPLRSAGEHDGIAPCKASSNTSAEAKDPCRIEGQEEELICTRFGKTFLGALELNTHEEQHSSGKRFNCSECSTDFPSSSILEKHLQIHSRKKPFTCSRCDKSFSQLHVLQAHESSHTGQKLYVCTKCRKCFHFKSFLKAHQRFHAQEKLFTCKECGKCFSRITSLENHQSVHTGEKLHHCNECGKSFSLLGSLKIHQRVHTREKSFSCKQCGKCFSQKGYLKAHQITHTREKCFSCAVCNKSFAYLHVLKQHQSVHTGEKPHRCDECGKCFAQQRNLKSHERVHTREKPFACKECGKCFSRITSLRNHQNVHTGEKPHHCNECGKCFSLLGSLKIHQRVHTREKPFSCKQCGKCFSQKSNLKSHQMVHTGEKPHHCNECGKSFTLLGNLKIHQRVHTREKPFTCKECGKCFSRISSLKNHQSVHTGEKPHHCNECGKSFPRLGSLKIHQRVHGGVGETIQLHTIQQESLPEPHSSETHTFSQSGLQTHGVLMSWGK